ncbi:GDP-fucose protein O-fucosyltransferase 2 isoform X2 [Phymastichus coffea]|uniref:GDP-fucose protein O-fucosyltransferase 2 isoform X2 n=1 Tax=Phymastichus coffea TaxID=108790 RepID=UPI00273A8F2A|nr:GDP-fucose protein O-fucosyltransferase 2 isoform X2 [Phymastichus coffea]
MSTQQIVAFIVSLIVIQLCYADNLEYCHKTQKCEKNYGEHWKQQSNTSIKRYIFYDVNPPEGFNLRRDVYIRVSTFIHQLAKEDKLYEWKLVLPPWGHLYHWKSNDVGPQKQIPWGTFFDVESLKKYAPVIEMHEFFEENGRTVLDYVYFLRNDEEMFKTGNFEDKNIITSCPNKGVPYEKGIKEEYTGVFWYYSNITAKKFDCITFHGTTLDLKENLHPNLYKTIMFDHMEIPLHSDYGSANYWKARRSMRYNKILYRIAEEFRSTYLKSNDFDDKTERPKDWRVKKKKRDAIGGPYLAVHYRRQDFTLGRRSPTIENTALQIIKALKSLNLNMVFIATDTHNEEYHQLTKKLAGYDVFRFIPSNQIKQKYKDGGVAIIDQIICSHARHFIGTKESTFTYRIQEDREILSFPVESTFNNLCPEGNTCSPEGRWEIVWE